MSNEMNNALQTVQDNAPEMPGNDIGVFSNHQAFAGSMQMARALTSSSLVPQEYRGDQNLGNALIALEVAQRTGSSPLMVMQNLYIVHGRPGWSAQFIIAALNACGRFSPLRFEIKGEGDNRACFAWTEEKATGQRLEGPEVTIAMAKDEGWVQKKGSKWQTMPEVMLRYRAASFFGRLYAPDILMGMQTAEELSDVVEVNPATGEVLNPKPASRTAQVAAKPEPQESAVVAEDGAQAAGEGNPGVSLEQLLQLAAGAESEEALAEVEDLARSLPAAGDKNKVRAAVQQRRKALVGA